MYTLKEIWEMDEKKVEKILNKNKIHISNFPIKNKIKISLLFNSKKLIEKNDIKYIEDLNFKDNMLSTTNFEEAIDLFNFFETPMDVINVIYKKSIPNARINRLLNDTNKMIMSDFNIYLCKSLIKTHKYKLLGDLDYLYIIFTNFKDKKIIKIYETILKVKKSLNSFYIICKFFYKESINILFDIFIFFYDNEINSNDYIDFNNNDFRNTELLNSYFKYIKTYYPVTIRGRGFITEYFDYLFIISSKMYSKELLNELHSSLICSFIDNSFFLNVEEDDYQNFKCKENQDLTCIFYITNAVCGNYITEENVGFYKYFIRDFINLYMYLTIPEYIFVMPEVIELSYFEVAKLEKQKKYRENNHIILFKNIIKYLCFKVINNVVFDINDFIDFFIYGEKKQIIVEDNKIYERGINVHFNNRDSKTNEAINILIEYTSSIDHEKYYKKFIKYMENVEEEKKFIIRKVLFGENRTSKDFEGFFEKDVVYENFSGKEIIAKFWYFIKKYKTEKENLKESFINSILESYQTDYVVCNPGKIQRMVSRVLQGRLEDKNGVKINIDIFEDNSNKNLQITEYYEIQKKLVPFVNMYLYEESTRVKDWEELFLRLFEFIKDMKDEGTILSYEHTIYYLCFISNTSDLKVNQELSIMSLFDFEL